MARVKAAVDVVLARLIRQAFTLARTPGARSVTAGRPSRALSNPQVGSRKGR